MIALLKEEWQTEVERYKRTKYGKVVAIMIYYIIFTCVPIIVALILPPLLKIFSKEITIVMVAEGAIIIVVLLFNLSMFAVYKLKIPFFEQYRINASKPWPWEENPKQWNLKLIRSIRLNIINFCILAPILFYLDLQRGCTFILDPEKSPHIPEIIKYLVVLLIGQDFLNYVTHWMVHASPYLYKHIHKVHHEYKISTTLAGGHLNVIDYLLTAIIPAHLNITIAQIILGPLHMDILTIWMVLRSWESINAHCGYIFSWAPSQLIPFCVNDEFNDFHHSHNSGNYSTMLRFWDVLFGTNKTFREWQRRKRDSKIAKQ